jgi:DNA-binding transcriptional LysR family regulator
VDRRLPALPPAPGGGLRAGRVHAADRLRADDYPAVVGLVAAGLGVAVPPELALEPVRRKGVALVEMRPAVEREVVALTLPDLARVPAVDIMPGRLTRAGPRHREQRAAPGAVRT